MQQQTMPPTTKPTTTQPRQKPAKRSRITKEKNHTLPEPDLSVPFFYSIYANVENVDQTSMQHTSTPLQLSIPDPSDECPITALPMADPTATSDLSFIPEPKRVFCLARPKHTKATLPCGHAFSAVHLVYYWAKASMRCPCCREGSDNRASVQSLPSHLRHDIATKIEASTLQDARESVEEDRQAAIFIAHPIPYEASLIGPFRNYQNMHNGVMSRPSNSMAISALRFDYTDLASEGNLHVRVTFYERQATSNILRVCVIISSALRFNPDEGGAIQADVVRHVERQNGARQIFSPSNDNNNAIPIPPDAQSNFLAALGPGEQGQGTIRERSFTPEANTIRTMSQIACNGLQMLKFSVFAKIREEPGSPERVVEIESSQKLTLPPEGLRHARLIVPGRNQVQSRIIDEGIEISVGDTGGGGLSQFHVCFSDEETPKISSFSWVPNQRHMHWFRFD